MESKAAQNPLVRKRRRGGTGVCTRVTSARVSTYRGGFFKPLVTWLTLDLQQSVNKNIDSGGVARAPCKHKQHHQDYCWFTSTLSSQGLFLFLGALVKTSADCNETLNFAQQYYNNINTATTEMCATQLWAHTCLHCSVKTGVEVKPCQWQRQQNKKKSTPQRQSTTQKQNNNSQASKQATNQLKMKQNKQTKKPTTNQPTNQPTKRKQKQTNKKTQPNKQNPTTELDISNDRGFESRKSSNVIPPCPFQPQNGRR